MGLNFSPSETSWFIGTFAVLHFLLVSVAGLAPLTIYLMEGYALKRNNTFLPKIGKQLLTIVLELAAVGGILGSGVVVVLVALRSQPITLTVNIFFWLLVLQLVSFIAGLAFQFAYYFSWDTTNKRHRLWGLLGALFPLIPFIVFSAAVSFLSTPGQWPQTGNIWHAVFNPSYLVSLLHRIGAGLSLLGVLIIMLNIFRRNKADGEQREYYEYAVRFGGKLAMRALEAQVVIGILRIFVMPNDAQKMIMGGELTVIWILGIVAGIVAWLFLFFIGRKDKRKSALVFLSAAFIPVMIASALMGVTRSRSRGEFSMRDIMTRSDEILTLPPNYQVAAVPDGATIYSQNCGACHPGLAGDAPTLAKQRHPDPTQLANFLGNPAALGIAMPPYQGNDEELKSLVSFLLDIPIEDVVINP